MDITYPQSVAKVTEKSLKITYVTKEEKKIFLNFDSSLFNVRRPVLWARGGSLDVK